MIISNCNCFTLHSALNTAKKVGRLPDLVSLFVVITGVVGMAVGDFAQRLLLKLVLRKGGSGPPYYGAGPA